MTQKAAAKTKIRDDIIDYNLKVLDILPKRHGLFLLCLRNRIRDGLIGHRRDTKLHKHIMNTPWNFKETAIELGVTVSDELLRQCGGDIQKKDKVGAAFRAVQQASPEDGTTV